MARCANCDAEIPEGGNFCVECGAPAPQAQPAATGATERLPDRAAGPACPACGTRNPAGASFCVTCGRPLAARPVAEPPEPASLPMSTPAPLAYAPAQTPAAPAAQGRRRRYGAEWGGIVGGLWLIGIAVLAVTGWWWPGIMVLIGISALVSGLAGGKDSAERWAGVQGAIWTLGIAVLALFGWWWPGILVLAGLSAIVGAAERPKSS
jgi:hypothetical protein